MKSTSPFGDKRTALAFFLSLIVIITYTELILKPQQMDSAAQRAKSIDQSSSQEATPVERTSGAQLNGGPKVVSQGTDLNAPTSEESSGETLGEVQPPSLSEISASSKTVVESEKYRATITHLGGRMLSFKLKNHTKELHGEELYDLVSISDGDELPFGISLLGGNDARISFGAPDIKTAGTQAGDTITLDKGQELRLTFRVALEGGGAFTKTYRFVGGTHFVDLTAELANPDSEPLKLSWGGSVPEEIAANSYDPVSFSFLFPNDKVEHLGVVQVEDSQKEEKVTQWASLGDKYFMTSLIALDGSQPTTVSRNGDTYTIQISGDKSEVGVKAFLGPKKYSDLKKLDHQLHRNVNLGIFSFLAIPLLTIINICYGFLGNYGLAIILMTLIIKFLFLPLTQVSFKSMKAMQDLQPEIKALRERIKDSNQLNQEMFALYKRKGVNPMGGCFPMFIQIPVFLGLYNALLNATELRHSPFALWITDLSAPEALNVFGIPIPVMIILMGISMFLQQWLTPSNMDEQQKKIMMMMPVMFTVMFIIFPFPSGLVLYWLVNNLISIVQQVYLRTDRNVGPTQATALASVGIFLIGYTLTLI